ncbi:hypothetical protein SASPL_130854 [Salvia splendens]|uniref:Protein kinase domain-containing protein n=1 Tax=Salvia splendens TaxID=180675 RepID=A0A8X8X815_SALSN|nr:hypothetical protein SASPL_130854 [Salvia splendens]
MESVLTVCIDSGLSLYDDKKQCVSNVLLVNSSANHRKVGDFGLSKLIRVKHSHDVYKMTGETGSYRYMAPEFFKHRKYDKKVDVFFLQDDIILGKKLYLHNGISYTGMVDIQGKDGSNLLQILEGDPPMSQYEPYEAATYVAEGHIPIFRSTKVIPKLKELAVQCWSADMNQMPPHLEILKILEKIEEYLLIITGTYSFHVAGQGNVLEGIWQK